LPKSIPHTNKQQRDNQRVIVEALHGLELTDEKTAKEIAEGEDILVRMPAKNSRYQGVRRRLQRLHGADVAFDGAAGSKSK
jgi:hypothetical protein